MLPRRQQLRGCWIPNKIPSEKTLFFFHIASAPFFNYMRSGMPGIISGSKPAVKAKTIYIQSTLQTTNRSIQWVNSIPLEKAVTSLSRAV